MRKELKLQATQQHTGSVVKKMKKEGTRAESSWRKRMCLQGGRERSRDKLSEDGLNPAVPRGAKVKN